MRRPLLIALLALLALFLAGCGGEETVSPTGPVVGPLPKAATGNAAVGKVVFNQNGCGGCHAFKAAGSSGMIGPNLDEALKGKDADFIKQSVVDPNAEIAAGFQPDIMPPSYGSQLTSKQIADLVSFLQQGT